MWLESTIITVRAGNSAAGLRCRAAIAGERGGDGFIKVKATESGRQCRTAVDDKAVPVIKRKGGTEKR